MKVIIAGSRTIHDMNILIEAIKLSQFDITEVVSGNAKGVDRLGEAWGENHNVEISLFPAMWSLHGRAAGFRRNASMGKYADALIAIWNGVSKKTAHMIRIAKQYKLKIYVHKVDVGPRFLEHSFLE